MRWDAYREFLITAGLGRIVLLILVPLPIAVVFMTYAERRQIAAAQFRFTPRPPSACSNPLPTRSSWFLRKRWCRLEQARLSSC